MYAYNRLRLVLSKFNLIFIDSILNILQYTLEEHQYHGRFAFNFPL